MIYLDYAATNPFTKYPCSKYGQFLNPNANYAYKEQKLLDDCSKRVKAAIGTKSGKVVFGGTSSQLIENLFTHIYEETNEYLPICSMYEHDSVWRFTNQWGNIDSLKHVVQTYYGDKQLIVCLMGVNNITGEIMPVEEIGELCRKHGAFFICDITAQIGKAPIPANIDQWCDCAVWSGHKLGTEGGIGAMWLSDKFNEWLGDFKLHGTPNLAGAMAITDATEDACDKWPLREQIWHYADLANYLSDALVKNNIEFNIVPEYPDDDEPPFAYAINAIMFDDINADSLQQYLASKQVYIGIGGSACSSLHDFRVLNAYGLTNDEANRVVRISFGNETIEHDIDEFVNGVVEYKEKFVR